MYRAVRSALFIAVTLLFVMKEEARAQHSSYEQLQAAYIFNFAKYISWPQQSERFVIGVFGEAEIMEFLEGFSGRKIGGKPVEFRIVREENEMLACHIIYVSQSGSRNIRSLTAVTTGKNILIVTEDDLIRRGAAISFVVEDDHLKFKLKHAVLLAAGLKATEGLLKLAIIE